MNDIVLQIENFGPLLAFSESLIVYPLVLGIHLLGLSLAVGLLAAADLHLAGILWKQLDSREVVRVLRPWFLGGFTVVFVSGLLLFAARLSLYIDSTVFWVKSLLMCAAAANAWYFEKVVLQHQSMTATTAPDRHRVTPRQAGLTSLGLWISIVVLGRLLAYF
jgi:hypothetical protein